MRTLIGGSLVLLTLALSACGGSSSSSASDEALQRDSDLYAISQIEKSFHEAITKRDIDEMMSLYAPNATATFGPGETNIGEGADPGGLAELGCVQADHELAVGPSGIQAEGHHHRRPRHAPLRVPLRRPAHPQDCGGHGGQHRRRPDRRPLADHQLRRKHRRAEALSTACQRTRRSRARQPARRAGC